METLVAFLPALFVAGKYWPPVLISIIGLVYIVGRFVYWRAYVNDPSKRGTGFFMSMVPTFALIALALVGSMISLFTGNI